jgi:hypothetical protein
MVGACVGSRSAPDPAAEVASPALTQTRSPQAACRCCVVRSESGHFPDRDRSFRLDWNDLKWNRLQPPFPPCSSDGTVNGERSSNSRSRSICALRRSGWSGSGFSNARSCWPMTLRIARLCLWSMSMLWGIAKFPSAPRTAPAPPLAFHQRARLPHSMELETAENSGPS